MEHKLKILFEIWRLYRTKQLPLGILLRCQVACNNTPLHNYSPKTKAPIVHGRYSAQHLVDKEDQRRRQLTRSGVVYDEVPIPTAHEDNFEPPRETRSSALRCCRSQP